MPISPLLVGALETVLNQYLKLDPDYANGLLPMAGKRLRMDLSELPFPLLFVFSAKQIDLLSGEQDDWDCRMQLAIRDLPRLQDGETLAQLIKQDRLQMEGQAELAQQFAAMHKGLDIDWQEPLSRWLGDPATHMVAQALTRAKAFVVNQTQEGKQQFGRFITDEVALLAHPLALAAFADDVQLLAADVDDVEARVRRLERSQAALS
ncbi:hypothetical protein DU002_15630 [Corallincola holothuriorum]|uniref:Ubiquinone biosynthesis accessory factor UbiJ n=1 Tax=Corallincola holothuriorum TaxID=2282215 RepID=A0A368N652_9GAMM|nr:SCP2 sterol-binding domain-containing protein [Corallincola holothuriorum]RCU45483.1 hypothetical protein DU002_15630 [Corallincola holothuriorum]